MVSVICIAALALLAHASACPNFQKEEQKHRYTTPSPMYSMSTQPSIPTSFPPFELSQHAAKNTERYDRNVYRVSLDNTGSSHGKKLQVIRTEKRTPLITRPVIKLPYNIPKPRTISNECRCVKTIVKPQIYEQIISVPSIQRYIQTSHQPVYEKIHYEAIPQDVQEVMNSFQQHQPQQTQHSYNALQMVEAPRYEVASQLPPEFAQYNHQLEAQFENQIESPMCQEACGSEAVPQFQYCY